jgi:hypothetical protein
MSGMPGFKDHLSDTQMWQLTQLVKNADKIPTSVKAELTPQATAAGAPSAPVASQPADAAHEHTH